MGIFEGLNDIPALADFQASPAAPPESDGERVRAFLRNTLGSAWYFASIMAYTTINGESIYVAILAVSPVMKQMQVVSERADGTMALSAPVPLETPEQDNIIQFPLHGTGEHEPSCIDEIKRTFREMSRFFKKSDMPLPQKAKFVGTLAHAAQHLAE